MFEEIKRAMVEGSGLTKMFLDYDGTLVNLVSQPELAIADDALLALLRDLKREIPLYLITGRDLEGILSLTGEGFNTIAMHGSQFIDEEGRRWNIEGFEDYVAKTGQLLDKYSPMENEYPGLRIIDKKGGLQFHYYNLDSKGRDRLEKTISGIREEGFEMYYGKYIYELRIRGMNKGKAISRYVDRKDFIFFAGDDVTDEEAFEILKKHVTIKIGAGDTSARFRLESPTQMKELLFYLLKNKSQVFRKWR